MSTSNYLRGAAASLAALCAVMVNASAQDKSAAKVDAKTFIANTNRELVDIDRQLNASGWVQATYITDDTQYINALFTDRYLEFFSRKAGEAKTYAKESLDPATARALMLIRLGVSAPAPSDAAKRADLATLPTELDAMYGEGKYCPHA